MANLADAHGADVEIYVKALTTTIHADTPTGAPVKLHDLLDQLGLERQEVRTAGPVYIWHEVPGHISAAEQKRLATRAIPALLRAGYKVSCTSEVFDEGAPQQAVRAIRAAKSRPAAQYQAPTATSSHPASPRRTP
ncbi:hypothetical protein ABCR94_33120 [Streptomyces sp. 21So2-11]|uniref:hypothetical protein n=1 Tax=Streptomyces sp. 21So2-11 TaxID=3144408 RepID=UPI00321966EB